jgi:ectoine hydroxylase-related dioxygenase (phytanoyl-CoA dioxygenase family)
VEAPDFEAQLAARAGDLGPEEQAVARALHYDGYAVVRRAVPTELCERVRREVEPYFEEDYARTERRVPDAWRRGAESVRALATDARMQALLATLYGRRPIPFQTLTFKWGTEQAFHADSVHFTSVPERFLCGVWVALEEVDGSSGPLAYYPGSHRLPSFGTFEPGDSPARFNRLEAAQRELMARLGVEPVEFWAEPGDALIWTANLLHGGRPITRPGATRWSQVTHYYFEDCLYYQPIYSDALTGRIKLMDIVDLNSLAPVPPRYQGQTVTVTPTADGRARLALDHEPPDRSGEVDRLAAELGRVTADRDALARSESFRIGQAVLAPLDWGRRAARRRRARGLGGPRA